MNDQEKLQKVELRLIEIETFLNSSQYLYIIAGLLFSYLAAMTGFIMTQF